MPLLLREYTASRAGAIRHHTGSANPRRSEYSLRGASSALILLKESVTGATVIG